MNLIAFDLDNTILDYEPALRQLKMERSELRAIDAETKSDLKSYVISEFGEDYWTELQGHLYTGYVKYASIDAEFLHLLEYLKSIKWRSSIISHKTKLPYMGPQLNMRDCALARLESDGIPNLVTDGIHFFETRKEKVEYINRIKPQIFVDDLIEILTLLSKNIKAILYSNTALSSDSGFPSISNWTQLRNYVEVETALG